MFCNSCGSSNPDGSIFCRACGNQLPVATGTQVASTSLREDEIPTALLPPMGYNPPSIPPAPPGEIKKDVGDQQLLNTQCPGTNRRAIVLGIYLHGSYERGRECHMVIR